MYEIWLGLNIVYELLLTVLPWTGGVAAVWVALMVAALMRRRAHWQRTFPASLAMGATIAMLALWFLPLMTKSSIYEMGYWVDWVNLAGLAGAVGGLAFAFIWPLLATVDCPHDATTARGAQL